MGTAKRKLGHDTGASREHTMNAYHAEPFRVNRRNVVLALQIEPELCAVPKRAAEPHCRVGGDPPAFVEDVRDAAGRHAKIEGETVRAERARLQLAL